MPPMLDLLKAHAHAVALVEDGHELSDAALDSAIATSEHLEERIIATRATTAIGITGKLRIAVGRARAEYGEDDMPHDWRLVESAMLDLTALAGIASGGQPASSLALVC